MNFQYKVRKNAKARSFLIAEKNSCTSKTDDDHKAKIDFRTMTTT